MTIWICKWLAERDGADSAALRCVKLRWAPFPAWRTAPCLKPRCELFVTMRFICMLGIEHSMTSTAKLSNCRVKVKGVPPLGCKSEVLRHLEQTNNFEQTNLKQETQL